MGGGIGDNSRVLERRTCLIVKSWTQEDNMGSLHTGNSLLGVWAFMGVTQPVNMSIVDFEKVFDAPRYIL